MDLGYTFCCSVRVILVGGCDFWSGEAGVVAFCVYLVVGIFGCLYRELGVGLEFT